MILLRETHGRVTHALFIQEHRPTGLVAMLDTLCHKAWWHGDGEETPVIVSDGEPTCSKCQAKVKAII